jgi:hypothetical protein
MNKAERSTMARTTELPAEGRRGVEDAYTQAVTVLCVGWKWVDEAVEEGTH